MANTHLASSLRVISAHVRMRFISIEGARTRVLNAAAAAATGTASKEDLRLVAKLERVTGCSISELAVHADDWA